MDAKTKIAYIERNIENFVIGELRSKANLHGRVVDSSLLLSWFRPHAGNDRGRPHVIFIIVPVNRRNIIYNK